MLNSSQYHVTEHLLDGTTVTIRALHAEDENLWLEVWDKLSPESRYARFLTYKRDITDAEVNFFTHADFADHVALLALLHKNDKLIPAAVARYVVVEKVDGKPQTAEFALMVDDEYQGLGIGTLLLRHLAIIARDAGITSLCALVLTDNSKMLEVLDHWGLPMEKRVSNPGAFEVKISLAPNEAKHRLAGTSRKQAASSDSQRSSGSARH